MLKRLPVLPGPLDFNNPVVNDTPSGDQAGISTVSH